MTAIRVLARIGMLREAQGTFEASYLNGAEGHGARPPRWS